MMTEPESPDYPPEGAGHDAFAAGALAVGDHAPGDECALIVDIDGYEGPLDLLLGLARTQKVDLAQISILALVEQYLAFIDESRGLRIEVAADYLVMAAWLAFLKSKLLLPRDDDALDELSGEDMAVRLAFRLERLAAMRDAAASLMNRRRLGRDVFQRGLPEGVQVIRTSTYSADVIDLLKAYTAQRERTVVGKITIVKRRTWSLREARNRLEGLLGFSVEWAPLNTFLTEFLAPVEERASAIASTFSATLEMVREGQLELRQDEPFAPLFVRRVSWSEKKDPGERPRLRIVGGDG